MTSKWYPRPRKEMSEWERAHHRLYSRTDVGDADKCWPWTGATTGNGYAHLGQVDLYGERRDYPYGHRLAWALAHGRWPGPGEVVMHVCDNPVCVNPRHLDLGTQRQNCLDRGRSGRWTNQRKLSDTQVRWARNNGLTQQETARELGVSQTVVSNIRRGKTYCHATSSLTDDSVE